MSGNGSVVPNPQGALSAGEELLLQAMVDSDRRWHNPAELAAETGLRHGFVSSALRNLQRRGLATGPPLQLHRRWSETSFAEGALPSRDPVQERRATG